MLELLDFKYKAYTFNLIIITTTHMIGDRGWLGRDVDKTPEANRRSGILKVKRDDRIAG